jgi:hypothetical protein
MFPPCSRCHSKLDEHLKDPETSERAWINPLWQMPFLPVWNLCIGQFEIEGQRKRPPPPVGHLLDKLMTPHVLLKEHDERDLMSSYHRSSPGRSSYGEVQLKSQRIRRPGKLGIMLWIRARNYLRAKAGIRFASPARPPTLFWNGLLGMPIRPRIWREGNPAAIEMAKKHIQNPMGCIQCHDPHAAAKGGAGCFWFRLLWIGKKEPIP